MFQYFILPITAIQHCWNDNTRASLLAYLACWDMFLHLIWYWVGGYFSSHDTLLRQTSIDELTISYVNHGVLISLGTAAFALMILSYIMSLVFLRLRAKTKLWAFIQTTYIGICFIYYSFIMQYFGENTIITGLNFLSGIVMCVLLFNRRIMGWALFIGILLFILISFNRKLNWLTFDSLYQQYYWQQYWFWILTYVYFTMAKILLTTVAVYKIVYLMNQQQNKIHQLSQRDALTGIYNRRSVYGYLGYIWQAETTTMGVTMIYMDLDHFKSINDDYSHEVGDLTLMTVTQVVLATLGGRGVFGRMGGEEFVVVLPDETLAAGMVIAEELRLAVASQPIVPKYHPAFHVTSSFGVASLLCATGDRLSTESELREFTANPYGDFDIQALLGHSSAKPTSFEDYMKVHVFDNPILPDKVQHLLSMANTGLHTAKANGRNRVENGGFMVV